LVEASAADAAGDSNDVEVSVEKSGATVFKFIDPNDVELSDELKALAGEVIELLKGVSVSMVGDSDAINLRLGETLAPLLDYVPLSTGAIFEQLTGSSVETVLEQEGWGSVAAVEAVVCEQLGPTVRNVVSTLGGGGGVAARGDAWRHLYGHVCIWVEEVRDEGGVSSSEDRPQNEAYAQAEIQVKVASGQAAGEVVGEALPQILSAMKTLLTREDDSPGLDLAGKKLLYIKLGSRGDWPDIMPPEWKPEN